MAKIVASATLAATVMPLLSRHVRQPVLVGKHDINFSRHIDQNPKDEGNDTTVPSLLFGENIVPTTSGYKSVALAQMFEALGGDKEVVLVASVAESDTYAFSFIHLLAYSPTTGRHYHYNIYISSGELAYFPPTTETFTPGLNGLKPTLAAIKGKVFTAFNISTGLTIREQSVLGTFTPVFTGLSSSAVGIFAASGYLMAWSKNSIFWSALEDPTDFVPSDVTGAGGTKIVDLLGEIKYCKATQNGFIVYGDLNCVYAQASNDFRFPFIFKSIPYLVGISDQNDVSYGVSTDHIVKSGSAIYKVTKAQAIGSFQDFYTFLSSKKVERFENNRLVEYNLDNTDVMFTVVDGSATVLSYKSQDAEQYDYALIDFSNLGRQGKVKVDHSFVITWPFDAIISFLLVSGFEFDLVSAFDDTLVSSLGEGGIITEGINVICFVAKDGSMKLLLDSADYPANGTLILGPFQLAREAMVELTRVEATVANAAATSCTVLTSLTGEEINRDITLPAIQLGKKVRYNARVTGLNHSICIQGAFDLSSVLLELVPKAQR